VDRLVFQHCRGGDGERGPVRPHVAPEDGGQPIEFAAFSE